MAAAAAAALSWRADSHALPLNSIEADDAQKIWSICAHEERLARHHYHIYHVDLDTGAVERARCDLCAYEDVMTAPTAAACVLHLRGMVRVLATTRLTQAKRLPLRSLRLEAGAEFALTAPGLRHVASAGTLPFLDVWLDAGAWACLDGVRIVHLRVEASGGSRVHDANALELTLALDPTSYVASSPHAPSLALTRAHSDQAARARRYSTGDALATHLATLYMPADGSARCYRFSGADADNNTNGGSASSLSSDEMCTQPDICILCLEPANVLLACQPCGHPCVCVRCATMRNTERIFSPQQSTCPLCRQTIGALAMPLVDAAYCRPRRASDGDRSPSQSMVALPPALELCTALPT